jgi:hypothetical protein
MSRLFKQIKNEIYYGYKSIHSILSGYKASSLETRDWSEDGEFYTIDITEDTDDPYYICVKFNNGRHIPLPLLINENQSDYYLQKIIIKFFKHHTTLLDDAIKDCEIYYIRNIDK